MALATVSAKLFYMSKCCLAGRHMQLSMQGIKFPSRAADFVSAYDLVAAGSVDSRSEERQHMSVAGNHHDPRLAAPASGVHHVGTSGMQSGLAALAGAAVQKRSPVGSPMHCAGPGMMPVDEEPLPISYLASSRSGDVSANPAAPSSNPAANSARAGHLDGDDEEDAALQVALAASLVDAKASGEVPLDEERQLELRPGRGESTPAVDDEMARIARELKTVEENVTLFSEVLAAGGGEAAAESDVLVELFPTLQACQPRVIELIQGGQINDDAVMMQLLQVHESLSFWVTKYEELRQGNSIEGYLTELDAASASSGVEQRTQFAGAASGTDEALVNRASHLRFDETDEDALDTPDLNGPASPLDSCSPLKCGRPTLDPPAGSSAPSEAPPTPPAPPTDLLDHLRPIQGEDQHSPVAPLHLPLLPTSSACHPLASTLSSVSPASMPLPSMPPPSMPPPSMPVSSMQSDVGVPSLPVLPPMHTMVPPSMLPPSMPPLSMPPPSVVSTQTGTADRPAICALSPSASPIPGAAACSSGSGIANAPPQVS